jgi:tungstate transport system substrate-binding protein
MAEERSRTERQAGLERREFVGITGALLAGLGAACASRGTEDKAESPASPQVPEEPSVVRIASVKTAVEGNLLPELVRRFEQHSPFRIHLTTGARVYDLARNGKVDLVVSHYGHRDAETFVLDGLGEWPRTIFSNQMALVGPPGDPARVRGMEDAGQAFERIARSRSPFLVNELDGVKYLTEILWNAAGRPDRTGWLVRERTAKDMAMERASTLGAYSLWGLTPFLRLASSRALALEPLVLSDPLLQRMLVSIIVKPGGVRRTNTAGANAFQAYLLAPETQAAIRTIRYPGKEGVAWVPAGRHNRTAILPKG